MTIGCPSEQTSSDGSVVKSRRRRTARFSSTSSLSGSVERPQERDPLRSPRAISSSSSSIRAVNARSTYFAEVVDQEVGDDLADRLRVEPSLDDRDVAPVDDRRDRRGVGRRAPDPVLLESLDQGRLGVARRRLGEVLDRGDVGRPGRDVAFGQRREGPLGLVRGVVLALGVDPAEAVEHGLGRARPQPVASRPTSSAVVVSSSFSFIWLARARCQMSR